VVAEEAKGNTRKELMLLPLEAFSEAVEFAAEITGLAGGFTRDCGDLVCFKDHED